MPNGVPHSGEVKAAVMAALLAGQSVPDTARQYRLPISTIRNWRMDIPPSQLIEVQLQKREEIGDLLLDYLSTALVTLQLQAQHFGDADWLTKQQADAAAVLHGVITDKAIRLLEALEAGRREQEDDPA